MRSVRSHCNRLRALRKGRCILRRFGGTLEFGRCRAIKSMTRSSIGPERVEPGLRLAWARSAELPMSERSKRRTRNGRPETFSAGSTPVVRTELIRRAASERESLQSGDESATIGLRFALEAKERL
jgi:hypothetical protein